MTTTDQVTTAVELIDATLRNCRKIQPKFAVGSAQHSLLKNRIQALEISRQLLLKQSVNSIEPAALVAALPPVVSIIHKSQKALARQTNDNATARRLQNLIAAMTLAQTAIEQRLAAN